MKFTRGRMFRAAVAATVAAGTLWLSPAVTGASHGAAADQTAAETGLLVQTDFTTDWTEEPTSTDATTALQKAAKRAGAACSQYAKSLATSVDQAHASSSNFVNGGASASNRVVVYDNETAADAAFAAFKARTTSACLSKTMAATLPAVLAENPKVAKKVSGLTVKMGPGKTAAMTNESAAIQGTTTVTLKNGKKAKVYVNEEAVVTGRALNLLEFVNVGEQLDGVHDHLVATTTGRLQGALGLTQAGETAALAGALVPVPGYEYVEATPEEVNSIATALADPEVATYLNGRSIHSVVQNGTSVGIIVMTEFKPQYSAQPGFKTDAVASWAADDAESSTGTTQVSTGGNGQAMAVVTGSNGYTGHIFFAGGILVAIYSAGADPAATQAFVDEFTARAPA